MGAISIALLAGCVASPDVGKATDGPGSETVETLATGLDAPWSIAFAGETALVSERDSARILEIDVAGGTRVVAMVDGVAHGGEGGLLGTTVHEGYLYAYFSTATDNRVVRFELLGGEGGSGSGSLTLGKAHTVFAGIPVASNHNGGRIAFGPDGMLYITTGDAGESSSAQDLGSLGGKILRVTPDGNVPPDNPFPGSPVFTLGHRNPQGIAWADDGTMFASKFGQNTWDELNIIVMGNNYGWPEVEGIAKGEHASGTRFTDPVQQWATKEASPSGIAIAGDTIYIANLRGQRLREVSVADPSGGSEERFAGEYGRLRDVTVAPDGSLWILTNNTDGRGKPVVGDDRILVKR